MAYREARYSPDPSTQNGALILDKDHKIIGSGCNTFTKGYFVIDPKDDYRPRTRVIVTPEMLERPLKYSYVEHAERNAIYSIFTRPAPRGKNDVVSKFQEITRPEVMVCPWAACVDCARAIVQVGIRTLVRHKQASDRSPDRWLESIALADDILRAGGVKIVDYDDPQLFDPNDEYSPTIRHCEEDWMP